MTDKPNEAVSKGLADEKEARKKQDEQRAGMLKGKPTPTQEENDRFALGDQIDEHEADGSDPDPNNFSKAVEAKKPAGAYSTRAAEPAHPTHKK
jgi:hypothetical protein